MHSESIARASTGECSIDVQDLHDALYAHPLYELIQDERALRLFMCSHIFCVWDFQSLLKSLQRAFTCVTTPWLPTDDREARRLINEIVLDEESDIDPEGGYISHFELYLAAMHEGECDYQPIEEFTAALRRGDSLETAIATQHLPQGVGNFIRTTLEIANSNDVHRIAAVFSQTREDILPDIFVQLVDKVAKIDPERWSKVSYYLNRHIEVDGERHGPIARALVERVCGRDNQLWVEAEQAVRTALQARLVLWDAIAMDIRRTED